MKRNSPLARRTPLKRGGRVRPVNAKRRKKNWSRAHHSVERVLFVKSLPCVYAEDSERCAGEIHNHHTRNDGKSRKGPYTSIVPLCTLHHVKLHAAAGMLPAVDLKAAARHTEIQWLIGGEA